MTATPKQKELAALFAQATIIPVLTIERLADAVPLARALVAGGVRTLEITLRSWREIGRASCRERVSSVV